MVTQPVKIDHYLQGVMAQNTYQQARELIERSQSILIVFKQHYDGDAVASALAMAALCRRLDKKVALACANWPGNNRYSFLPTDDISSSLTKLQQLVISVDTTNSRISEFYYDRQIDKLNIYLTPESTNLKPEAISITTSHYRYDLIITVATPELEALGSLSEKNSDFFHQTPKLCFDSSERNDHYGNINVVELTSSSTAELLYDFFKLWMGDTWLDEQISTYLLTGIIAATNNFKSTHLTPKTLAVASDLITRGAQRERIIQNLYQNRFISTLKLWGRVLARVNTELDDRLIWSQLSQQDFLETGSSPTELPDVIDELIVSMPKVAAAVIVYEEPKSGLFYSLVYGGTTIDLGEALKIFKPATSIGLCRIRINQPTLIEAQRAVVTELKKYLQARP